MRMLGVKINFDYNAETKVFATLLHYRQNRFEAGVFYNCWEGHSQGIEKFEEFSGAQMFPIDTGWRPNPDGKRAFASRAISVARIHAALPKMLKIAKEYDPDVIYSCQQKWDCFAATHLAERLRRPQVIHLHSITASWLGKQALDRLKTCDHVITVSNFIRHYAIQHGVSRDRVTALRNAQEVYPLLPPEQRNALREALGIPQDAPVLGIVGRMVAGKGHADTIRAFGMVAARFPLAHLVLVGGGPLQADIEAQAKLLNMDARIHFTGMRSDVPDLLRTFDIFVHPTRMDAAPLAVLEACSAGLPVLAYEEGGVCEFVENGRTGLLTPVDSVEALAYSMQTLLADPARTKAMGDAGRERIARLFRPDDVGAEFSKILHATIP